MTSRRPIGSLLLGVELGFEPLEGRLLLTADFGDAAEFYPTLLSENGARHTATGPTLGATRDAEADGTHSPDADADGADEDGVAFGTVQVGQLGATATVNLQGGAAKLDAWIDFNGDGSWGGPGEHIADSVMVTVGNNALAFDVPSWAIDGVTAARFRLSSAGNLGVGGLALDGEVEDYVLTVLPPSAASGVFKNQDVIDVAADSARGIFAADVDGDGDLDVLSASAYDNKIAWYENDGTQQFAPHTITAAAAEASSVIAADVDGDGDTDVLSASFLDQTIAWYENDGSQNFTQRVIASTAEGAEAVFAADVDGDGDTDVLSASSMDNKIAWYENDGAQTFTAHTISTSALVAVSVFAADVDNDGDVDVLSASYDDNRIAWYENDGTQSFTTHTISAIANGASSVIAADVDGDGDTDVLSASSADDKIAWYENDGTQNFTLHVISAAAVGASSIVAADVDGDGDTDVLSASATDDKIAWYENDGTQTFTSHTISIAVQGAFSVFAADVDGDGDTDVLSASTEDDKIAWYENINPVPPAIDLNGNAPGTGFTSIWTNAGAISIADAAAASVTEDDGSNLTSLTATIVGVHPGDVLSATPAGAISVAYDAPNHILTLTGSDTAANYQAVLRTVQYNNTAGGPGVGTLAIDFIGIDAEGSSAPATATIQISLGSTVTARHIFYNQSVWDGNSALVSAASDNAARATDKTAYLPGAGLAVAANITSFTRGITGLMVDLSAGGNHAALTASDFVFKVGNNNTPSLWAAAPAPSAVSVIPGGGVGGSDRVEITWASGAIRNQWLEVQVKANANTGLAVTDIHFWGNKIADSGAAPGAGTFDTTSTDAAQVFATIGPGKPITDLRDYNRDGQVTSTDAAVVFANIGSIVRINLGAGGPFAPDAEPLAADPSTSAVASALAATPGDGASEVLVPPRLGHRYRNAVSHASQIDEYFRQISANDAPRPYSRIMPLRPTDKAHVLNDELLDDLVAIR